jgi:23S rRNA pseudouridine1911/1915/1917 synthase
MVPLTDPEPLSFRVTEGLPRDRLDKLVVRWLAEAALPTSRSEVQRWAQHGRVLVDGAPCKASAAVALGVLVEVRPEPPPLSHALPEPSLVVPIVYEDEHLLVVDKPAGLVVHPAKGHESGTLVNALLGRGGFESASFDARDPVGHLRPGIVHRLDRGTSGLLVVAKDAPTREALKALFAKHDIEREYLAVVVGVARDATYDTLHGRHPSERLLYTTRVSEGRRAVTHVRALESLGSASLVACRLETGRTHQIRVHLAECAGTPVLGDPLYGRPPRDPLLVALARELGHQALHARVLGFVHPATGRPLLLESALPNELSTLLARLRARLTRAST